MDSEQFSLSRAFWEIKGWRQTFTWLNEMNKILLYYDEGESNKKNSTKIRQLKFQKQPVEDIHLIEGEYLMCSDR